MCRWITLISAESVSLSDIVLSPSNSLVKLSRDASFHPGADFINNAHMNGDGFGVGWYHTNAALVATTEVASHDGGVSSTLPSGDNLPNGNHGTDNSITKAAIFKDISPAWSNENLREICLATKSNCIMAVRSLDTSI